MASKKPAKPAAQVKDTEAEIKETAKVNVPDFFEKLGNKSVWLCLGLISVIAFFVFKDFILMKKMFLYKDIGSDTINGVWPYFYFIADYFHKIGLPKWTFAEGLGQSQFAAISRDPFEYITYLMGPGYVPKIFIFIELSKLMLGGIVFYFFLKTLKISNYSAILGGTLFSFTGFMIIGACWYLFTFEALCMALFLLSFELLYQKDKWIPFVITVFLICVSMPFNLYFFGIFIAIYALFRCLQAPDYTNKAFFILCGKMIAIGIAGILLSGPFLLENLMLMAESPRGSGGNSYFNILSSRSLFALNDKWQFGSAIMRMFSSDILGSGSNFKGWNNNYLEAPFSYCGIISLILMPQIFPFLNKKVRRWYVALLVIWLVPTIFPYFRYMLWLFTGDYYRAYSFFVSLVFIIFSVYALDFIIKNRKINLVVLASTVVLLLILVSYPYFKGMGNVVDTAVSLFVKIFIFVYAGILFLIAKAKNPTNLKYILLALIAFELIYLSGLSVNRRDVFMARELKEKVSYNDYTVDAVSYLKEKDKSFYRIDKLGYFSGGAMHGSLIDHKIQGYYGTSSYNSWAHFNYINYFRAYGIISKENEFEARWVPGLNARPILEVLNHVKYVVAKQNPRSPFYDSIANFGDVKVFSHKFKLPFGYTYSQYMSQSDFDKLSTTQKDLVSIKACILKDGELSQAKNLSQYHLKDTISIMQFSWEYFKKCIDDLKADSLVMDKFSENYISGKINVSADKILCMSFVKDEGWKLNVDGVPTEKLFINNGLTGIPLKKGAHTIELTYNLRFFKKGLMMSLGGLAFCGGLFFFFRRPKSQKTED